MPLFRLILPLMLLLVSACMLPPIPQPGPDFYVMRHLDTTPGQQDPDLTPEGRRRAQALADWFTGEPPAVIFVSDTKRARQTAGPLATKLGLVPVVYDPRNTPGLIAEIVKSPNPALIVGHSFAENWPTSDSPLFTELRRASRSTMPLRRRTLAGLADRSK